MQDMGVLVPHGALPFDIGGQWRWTVDQRFNVGVEGARQAGFGGMFDGSNGAVGLGRSGDAAHSVQVRGGVSF